MFDGVAIVDMEQRAPHDGLAQIEAKAAVAEEIDVEREHFALGVETGPKSSEERMSFAGDGHVAPAIEAHAHGPTGFACAQRGNAGEGGTLHFLAAEGSSHAQG